MWRTQSDQVAAMASSSGRSSVPSKPSATDCLCISRSQAFWASTAARSAGVTGGYGDTPLLEAPFRCGSFGMPPSLARGLGVSKGNDLESGVVEARRDGRVGPLVGHGSALAVGGTDESPVLRHEPVELGGCEQSLAVALSLLMWLASVITHGIVGMRRDEAAVFAAGHCDQVGAWARCDTGI
jgi:hypothetical protein